MRRAGCAVVTLMLVACSSGAPAAAADAGAEAAFIGCERDPRALTYAANLTKVGEQGTLQLALVQAAPAPPLRGTNTWRVRVERAGGAAAAQPAVNVTLLMPEHGHGSSVTPVVTAQPDGSFEIAPLYLFMPGLWQATFALTSGADTDTVVMAFCVAG